MAAAALAAGLLAGCATTPPQILPGEPWTTGRLLLRVDASATQAASSFNAGFELRGSEDRGELRLNSPLGPRIASARWAPGQVILRTGTEEARFDSLDALSRQALGEAVPLAALPDWLAGRPWPRAPHVAGELGFEQLGWHVSLARRADGLIEARRAAAPALLLRVRVDEPEAATP